MTYFEALIIAIVEGITEFLPISSTGHMIVTSALLGLKTSPFLSLFTISIQFGAILSVVALYWKRFFQSLQFYFVLVAAIIPTVLIALLLKKYVDIALGSVIVVGINLLIGGLIIMYLEKKQLKNTEEETPISYKKALWIGCVQSISIFPGVSRSAATIYGGIFQGLSRKQATEFSFFLAVPIMFLATVKDFYDFYKEHGLTISSSEINLLIFGNIVAFIVAIIAIKFFINYIVKHGFYWFGIYRVLIGIIIIIAYQFFDLRLTP